MIVRPLRADDAEAVAELARGLGRATEGAGEITAEAVRRDFLDPAFGLACHVAEIDGVVVGYATHHAAYEGAFAARGRYLADLFVVPEARRKGVAQALIRAVARSARDEGGSFLWWVEMAGSPAAAALYEGVADISAPVTSYASTCAAFAALLSEDGEAD